MLNESIELRAESSTTSGTCPSCGVISDRMHSYYYRRPRDLPLVGYVLTLNLKVRRFRCQNQACAQATFAERLPTLVPVGSRRTHRLTEALRSLALAQGGEAGARYGQRTGLPVSADTLLRIVRQTPLPAIKTPRVLGVDDFALRKGRVYGTVLIDGESHEPIDLLADRTAHTLAQWLQRHPGVELITRDRSTEYARGATLGAPDAVQIADRWHLLGNLREAIQRLVGRLRTELSALPEVGAPGAPDPTVLAVHERDIRAGTKVQVAQQQSRARRYARYAQVRELHTQGYKILQIARQLQISRQTVRRYIASDVFPESACPGQQASILDPYVHHLQQRWDEGCRSDKQLYEEICHLGFRGSTRALSQWTMPRRRLLGISGRGRPPARAVVIFEPPSDGPPADPAAAHSLPTTRQLAWLVVKAPAALSTNEKLLLRRLQQSPVLRAAYQLAQQFNQMVGKRQVDGLALWITACMNSSIEELVTFAIGLQREEPIIRAALEYPFSNGPVEGQVTRIKQIRRTMYGRGNFDLLRRRVLMAA